MVTVGMYYEVVPGKNKEFEEKFFQVLKLMESIPGHRQSFLYRRVDDPNSYAIISEWDSEEAFRRFLAGDEFRTTTQWGREQILRGRPRHHVYTRTGE